MTCVASERLPPVAGSGPAGRVLDEAVVAQLVIDVGAGPAREICAVFLRDARERVSIIRRALDAADGDAAGRAAHRLKSAAGFVGASALSARCAAIERLVRHDGLVHACSQSGRLAAELEETTEEMVRHLGALAPPHWSAATP